MSRATHSAAPSIAEVPPAAGLAFVSALVQTRGRPVSRILSGVRALPQTESKPQGDHSSGPAVTGWLKLPTRVPRVETTRHPPFLLRKTLRWRSECAEPLCGIAPGGACHARPVARSAVGSYPTLSPLPPAKCRFGGLLSVALSLGLPRPGVTRHRCLVESRLSSGAKPLRPPGRPRTAYVRTRTSPVKPDARFARTRANAGRAGWSAPSPLLKSCTRWMGQFPSPPASVGWPRWPAKISGRGGTSPPRADTMTTVL